MDRDLQWVYRAGQSALAKAWEDGPDMDYMSEHFSREEMACKCGCGFDGASRDLLAALEDLRAVVKRPVRINSGCRCQAHNAEIGGATGSMHTVGKAADVVIAGVPPLAVGWIARTLGCFAGIKVYDTWTHLDIREGTRWLQGF